jgi:hypothetical protein
MSALVILVSVALASNTRPVAAGMEVPNAIVKQHNAYVLCQDANFDIQRVTDKRSFIAEVEKAITACSDQKSVLSQEAEKTLLSTAEYADPAKRRLALCEAFDSYDEMRRAMALGTKTYKVTCR